MVRRQCKGRYFAETFIRQLGDDRKAGTPVCHQPPGCRGCIGGCPAHTRWPDRPCRDLPARPCCRRRGAPRPVRRPGSSRDGCPAHRAGGRRPGRAARRARRGARCPRRVARGAQRIGARTGIDSSLSEGPRPHRGRTSAIPPPCPLRQRPCPVFVPCLSRVRPVFVRPVSTFFKAFGHRLIHRALQQDQTKNNVRIGRDLPWITGQNGVNAHKFPLRPMNSHDTCCPQ